MVISMPCMFADNELSKKEQKQIDKEVKAKMKEYKKGNWQILGSTRTLEGALRTHMTKLAQLGENGTEVSGIATKCKSKNVGKQMANQNACITYAKSAGSQLQGRIVSDIAGNGTDAEGEFENFYAAYESSVEKEIRGEMSESFSIISENPDGTYQVMSFYIVNEDAAHKARLRALEKAAEESKAAQAHAKEISDFVRGRVTTD